MASASDPPAGVLRLDKPPGPTSHDAVAIARRALKTRRVGHTGTLDPFASGLLLLCVGWATRLAEHLAGLPKTYQAVMRLGEETDTLDPTGTVIVRSEHWRELTLEQVAEALAQRVGRQQQVPPAYSAKKVAGEPLYEKARRGEAVTPQAVPVEIASIRLTSWDPPLAGFETTCSSGTYIRAIARDVGRDLSAGAHLVELRRTAVGPHSVRNAVPLDELAQRHPGDYLLDPLAALPHLPRLGVDDAGADAIRHGRTISISVELTAPAVLVVWRERLLAVAACRAGRLQPRKVFDA
jgi:tRNA pseudouridine55 synthase